MLLTAAAIAWANAPKRVLAPANAEGAKQTQGDEQQQGHMGPVVAAGVGVVVTMALIGLALMAAAITIAVRCGTPGSSSTVWHVMGAALFPEIYLLQAGVRKAVAPRSYCVSR